MRNRFKLSIAVGAFAAALGLAAAQPARAAVLNGSFEDSPDFVFYTTIGNTSIQDSNFTTAPDGNQQALLSSNTKAIPGQFGSEQNVGVLDAFFNLSAGSLEGKGVTSGSGVKQTFTASAGDQVKFFYDFATNEGTNQDIGFFTLQGPGTTTTFQGLAQASDATQSTDPLTGINSLFNSETGYKQETGVQSFILNITANGTYTLAFGVANVGDTAVASGLLIDNITGATGAAVPLPSTAWTGFALLGGLGIMQLTRRRRVAH